MINTFQMVSTKMTATIEFHANFRKFSLMGDAMRYYNVASKNIHGLY